MESMMVIKVEDAKMVATIPITDQRHRGLMESQLGMYAFEGVPVVHGRWIKSELSAWPIMMCSACGELFTSPEKTAFCPYCGAKMDGDTNG